SHVAPAISCSDCLLSRVHDHHRHLYSFPTRRSSDLERIYTRGLLMEFIRMRSPSKAPPVFFFEGSTEINAIFFSGKSIRKRRTNSSTIDDFPAPPVPVIPKTGTDLSSTLLKSNNFRKSSSRFSANEINREIVVTSLSFKD